MRKLEVTTALSLFAPSTKETNNLIVEGVIKRTLNQKTLSADHGGYKRTGTCGSKRGWRSSKGGLPTKLCGKSKGMPPKRI